MIYFHILQPFFFYINLLKSRLTYCHRLHIFNKIYVYFFLNCYILIEESHLSNVTSVRIAGDRKKMIERIALEAGMKCGRIIRISDVVHFLIDRYSNLELIDELQKKYSQYSEKSE